VPIIDSGNLKFYLSGGAGNTDPNASLGGARSTTAIVTSTLANLFDNINSTESTAGDTEYRCLFFRNEDSNANGLVDPVIWISSNTPSADTTIEIGLDTNGKNSAALTIVNESTAPAGVTFSVPTTKGTGLALPSDPYMQNDYVGIWVKRIVTAGAFAASNDPATLRIEGDSF
jgi:hypothetical protein